MFLMMLFRTARRGRNAGRMYVIPQLMVIIALAAITAAKGYGVSLAVAGSIDAALLLWNRLESGSWRPVPTVMRTMAIVSLGVIPVVGAFFAVIILVLAAIVGSLRKARGEMRKVRNSHKH